MGNMRPGTLRIRRAGNGTSLPTGPLSFGSVSGRGDRKMEIRGTMLDCEGFFELEPAQRGIDELETPMPVVDLDIVERNAARLQKRCDKLGLANRPHIKTHKLVPLAKYQMALGACGITVQTVGEAEVMAAAGLSDIMLTFNIVGRSKLARLSQLRCRVEIKVVADNSAVVAGLGEAGTQAGSPIGILVECDTGHARNGVQSPSAAAELAGLIDGTPGVRYAGLMTFPATGTRRGAAEFLCEAKRLAEAAGLETECVSTGGTPDMWSDEGLAIATEYRAGTCIYNDRSLLGGANVDEADCAFDVLATVVSRPTGDRAVLDAGSKALTSDLMGLEGFGCQRGTGALVYSLSEEHGLLDVRGLDSPPEVGDMVRIIPNHVCPVSNLFDRIAVARSGEVLGMARVDARGRSQ